MALWLCKQEPDCYSFDDLERDGQTVWDGVANALARIHLRAMKPGDRVLFYHTGKEKAIVGEMEVTEDPKPDPNSDDEKSVVVAMKVIKRLPNPVPLADIKEDKLLAEWDLVKMSRLSVMPVTAQQWKKVMTMAVSKKKTNK